MILCLSVSRLALGICPQHDTNRKSIAPPRSGVNAPRSDHGRMTKDWPKHVIQNGVACRASSSVRYHLKVNRLNSLGVKPDAARNAVENAAALWKADRCAISWTGNSLLASRRRASERRHSAIHR